MHFLLFIAIGCISWLGCESPPLAPPPTPPATAESDLLPLNAIRPLPTGTRMHIRTAFAGEAVEDLEVRLVGVVDDMLPPISLIMLEATDPKLVALGGVSSGMSGSPLIYEGQIVGALSYSFPYQSRPPFYFFATPIFSMLNSLIPGPAAKPTAHKDRQIIPISSPLVASGVASELLNRNEYPRRHLVASGAGSAPIAPIEYTPVPGSPIGVSFVLGDEVNIASVGTISYIRDDRLYAFGHAMENLGSTSLPLVGARILAEISGLDSPFKFFSLGRRVLGTMYADRLPGIGGILGPEPELVKLTLQARLPYGGHVSLTHHIPRTGLSPDDRSWLAGVALFSPLMNRLDNASGRKIRTRTRMTFSSTDLVLDRTRLFTNATFGSQDLLYDAMNDYSNMHWEVDRNALAQAQLTHIAVEAEITDQPLVAHIKELYLPDEVSVGADIRGQVVLAVDDSTKRQFGFTMAIPDTFVAGQYQVLVGNSWYLDTDEDDWQDPLTDLIATINQENMDFGLIARLDLIEQKITAQDHDDPTFRHVESLTTYIRLPLDYFIEGERRKVIQINR